MDVAVTEHEVRWLVQRGCVNRRPWLYEAVVRRAARHEAGRAWVCPYARCLGVPAHFHISRRGPTVDELRKIAASMRWMNEHGAPFGHRALGRVRRRLDGQRRAA